MEDVPRFLAAALFALSTALSAQSVFFPLQNVKAGMRGVGRTVFSGDRVEEFQVEILGVLENIGPKQSLVLARLSGGPLAQTGVLQGMSGSPVYVDGKLLGAVAMAFPFAKEPIAGIRPIEEMVRVWDGGPATGMRRAAVSLADRDLTAVFSKRQEMLGGDARLMDISTPVSFGGFTSGTLEQFAPQLRALGLEPLQGTRGGGRTGTNPGPASALKPGSMISVELMTGDMSIGADGTVTYIDGDRIYAFGHRFLSVGSTAIPFARAEVITLLPTLSSSFKISNAKELMGVISQDRNTAIAGVLGKRAGTVPVSISLSRAGRKLDSYRMQIVNDRYLSPLLVQMAVFSAIDATERSVGASSFTVKGQIEFDGATAPVKLNNMFAADNGSAMQVSLSAAVPLAYVLQSGFQNLKVKQVDLNIESFDEKKQLQIDRVYVSRREARPGEKLVLTAILSGENGKELARTATYTVPQGAQAGTLYFTVADGNTTNLAEFRQIIGTNPKSPSQLVSIVNHLRDNTKAYVRVWRADPAYQLEGADLPDPPPSVSLVLSGLQNTLGGITQTRNSKIAELEIGAGEVVITGSKTIQVEVKE